MSNDGEFFMYGVEFLSQDESKVILQSINTGFKQEFENCELYNCVFAENSMTAFVKFGEDSLAIINLRKKDIEYLSRVHSFKVVESVDGITLCYSEDGLKGNVNIYNLESKQRRLIIGVVAFHPSTDHRYIYALSKNENAEYAWSLIKLDDLSRKVIWTGHEVQNVVTAPSDRLAFAERKNISATDSISVWLYHAEDGRFCDVTIASRMKDLVFDRIQEFSSPNQLILRFNENKKITESDVKQNLVDIYSSHEPFLHLERSVEVGDQGIQLVRIDMLSGVIHLLHRNGENLRSIGEGIYVVSSNGNIDPSERNWNEHWRDSVYIVHATKDTIENILTVASPYITTSTSGRYILWFELVDSSYSIYDIQKKSVSKLTADIKTNWSFYYHNDFPKSVVDNLRGVAGWGANDSFVLLYDTYDIWKIYLDKSQRPVSITNGFGKRNGMVFTTVGHETANVGIKSNGTVLIAFDRTTKENGFYAIDMSKRGDPRLLSKGPFVYEIRNNPYLPDNNNSFTPVPAKNGYVVKRQSTTESPNFYFTTDFISFRQLTFLQPEKNVVWMNAELHQYVMPNGILGSGLLYKPDNFDSTRKYPVIFNYYENKTDTKNIFIKPEKLCGSCSINIPQYVTNDYLVFLPDIEFEVGNPGESTLQSVVTAADYLSRLPFVDKKRMGIQGCSLGGYETNYLVTHTNVFAAACSASGISDFISGYGSVSEDGTSLQGMYELTFFRMGKTIWDDPSAYIKNSPIFFVDKVNTPILLMHTFNDGVCPYANALEFFLALRRLKKDAWLLKYNEGNHGLQGKAAEDFSARMFEFFDHYLKDKPSPGWMNRSSH